MFDSNNFMGKMFGRVGSGMVRMSMNGDMAIKTSNGYKTYDAESGALVNCDNFVFDIGVEVNTFVYFDACKIRSFMIYY